MYLFPTSSRHEVFFFLCNSSMLNAKMRVVRYISHCISTFEFNCDLEDVKNLMVAIGFNNLKNMRLKIIYN